MSNSRPQNHSEIVQLLTRKTLREEFGLEQHQVRDWDRRNSIPPERWLDVAELASREGHKEITIDLLKELYERKREAAPKPNKTEAA